jgi:Tol biopolymer transport system component/class 3 adenylate cyclase
MVGDQNRKLATILAVDMVGYSASAEHDQARAAERVKWLERRLSDLAEKHGGRIFSTAGDGFMLEFALASSAVRAAIELLDAGGEPTVEQPRVRAGAHLGEVMTKGADLLGHGVNVAARLMAAAQPNHLVISEALHAQLHGEVDASFERLGPMRLNKMRESIVAYAYPPPSAITEWRHRLLAPVRRHWRTLSAIAAAGAAAVTLWHFTRPPQFTLEAPHVVAQTREPEIFPTLSPDGRFVVYTLDSLPSMDLFMRPAEGGEEIRLTDTADADEISAAFSPDGSQLAFVRGARSAAGSRRPCDIIVRPFPQGLERRVGGCATAPWTFRLSWSPDGSALIFSETRLTGAPIRRLDIESGQTSDFIAPPASGSGDFNAVFSPSGRRVAFVRYLSRGVASINSFDTRTRRVHVIMDGLAWAHVDWIDDGRIIAATRISDAQNRAELWILNAEGGIQQRQLPTVARLERVDYANGALAYQAQTRVANLRRFEGGAQSSVTSENAEDHDAAFSPNGVLGFIRADSDEWIFLQQPGESPRRFVRPAGHSAYGLRWSNDGRRLAYAGVREGRRSLFVTEVSSGTTRVIETPDSQAPANPAWGQDDRSLIYAGLSNRGARLLRVNLDGTQPAQPISDYGWVEAVETADGIYARHVDRQGVWLLTPNAIPRLVCGGLRHATLDFSDRTWAIGHGRIYVVEGEEGEGFQGSKVSSCPLGGGAGRQVLQAEDRIAGSLAIDPATGAIVFAELVERQSDIAVARLVRTRR